MVHIIRNIISYGCTSLNGAPLNCAHHKKTLYYGCPYLCRYVSAVVARMEGSLGTALQAIEPVDVFGGEELRRDADRCLAEAAARRHRPSKWCTIKWCTIKWCAVYNGAPFNGALDIMVHHLMVHHYRAEGLATQRRIP